MYLLLFLYIFKRHCYYSRQYYIKTEMHNKSSFIHWFYFNVPCTTICLCLCFVEAYTRLMCVCVWYSSCFSTSLHSYMSWIHSHTQFCSVFHFNSFEFMQFFAFLALYNGILLEQSNVSSLITCIICHIWVIFLLLNTHIIFSFGWRVCFSNFLCVMGGFLLIFLSLLTHFRINLFFLTPRHTFH